MRELSINAAFVLLVVLSYAVVYSAGITRGTKLSADSCVDYLRGEVK